MMSACAQADSFAGAGYSSDQAAGSRQQGPGQAKFESAAG